MVVETGTRRKRTFMMYSATIGRAMADSMNAVGVAKDISQFIV